VTGLRRPDVVAPGQRHHKIVGQEVTYWRHPDSPLRESSESSGCVAAEALDIPHVSVAAAADAALDLRDQTAAALEPLRSAAGLSPDPAADMIYRYLHLSFMPAGFFGPAARFPTTTRFLRHVDAPRPDRPVPDWWQRRPHQPAVLVSLGTVFFRTPGLYGAIIDGLSGEHLTVAVAVGHDQDLSPVTPRSTPSTRAPPRSRAGVGAPPSDPFRSPHQGSEIGFLELQSTTTDSGDRRRNKRLFSGRPRLAMLLCPGRLTVTLPLATISAMPSRLEAAPTCCRSPAACGAVREHGAHRVPRCQPDPREGITAVEMRAVVPQGETVCADPEVHVVSQVPHPDQMLPLVGTTVITPHLRLGGAVACRGQRKRPQPGLAAALLFGKGVVSSHVCFVTGQRSTRVHASAWIHRVGF